jgi:hypothetical protein
MNAIMHQTTFFFIKMFKTNIKMSYNRIFSPFLKNPQRKSQGFLGAMNIMSLTQNKQVEKII